jgi:hypothetical protein
LVLEPLIFLAYVKWRVKENEIELAIVVVQKEPGFTMDYFRFRHLYGFPQGQ